MMDRFGPKILCCLVGVFLLLCISSPSHLSTYPPDIPELHYHIQLNDQSLEESRWFSYGKPNRLEVFVIASGRINHQQITLGLLCPSCDQDELRQFHTVTLNESTDDSAEQIITQSEPAVFEFTPNFNSRKDYFILSAQDGNHFDSMTIPLPIELKHEDLVVDFKADTNSKTDKNRRLEEFKWLLRHEKRNILR